MKRTQASAHVTRFASAALTLLALLIPFATGSRAGQVEPAAPPDNPPLEVPLAWERERPSTIQTARIRTPRVPASETEVAWDDLPPDVQAKVDPRILAELRGEVTPAHPGIDPNRMDPAPTDGKPLEKTRFLVYLQAQADLMAIAQRRFASRLERRAAVFNALAQTAQDTQGPVNALLSARMRRGGVAAFQPFFVFNGFAVEGDLDTVIELARREDVARIVANYPLVPLWNEASGSASPPGELAALHPDNWNIDRVDADRVWDELGVTGEGAVVAGIDTGVDWDHPALQARYRGYSPSRLDHNYHWFDPDGTLYPGGDLGPSRSPAPFDNGSHGTHTMGTMVGDGGTFGTQVGMAPGARWIAISMNELSVAGGYADDIMAHKAFQWMLCPTDLSGDLATADCSRAPDVVNNSWGSANPADDSFRPDIAALRAAGIAPVFAAGNPSAGPGSIGAPGNAPEAITVGATDRYDQVASFSGRGPSFYEGEQKPELSAPGVDINSALPGGGYSGPAWSGTSMAAPHVAGLVALMVSADLQDGYRDFNVDELEHFMEGTAVDLGLTGPDDAYGYGRIDAYDAVRWLLSAGDLRGTVTDRDTAAPIEGATVVGTRSSPGDTFTARAGASGHYSTTVPAGTYDVTVGAWGYYSDTFSHQIVLTGSLSYADFALSHLPAAQLTGRVLSGTIPVGGALVTVGANPSVSTTTGADGVYTLTLPVGTHAMEVKATGYRVLKEDTAVAPGGSGHDFEMSPAPTILLVDAGTGSGWFLGWPVHNYFAWALQEKGYLYDLWQIRYTGFDDTAVMPDGSLGYGIPSTGTLRSYGTVIWAHGGSPTSPGSMNADDELIGYLDAGGRLIISGQNVGDDEGTTLYDDYLHAGRAEGQAAGEGDTVSGTSFLDGLRLEITNASLHGYPNGATYLSPDAVRPTDGAAYPALTYDNGSGAAALAVDPCDKTYRAVYFALGYENVAPRGQNRDPAIADALDRSIQWLQGSKPAHGVRLAATPSRQTGEPGQTVTYDVQVFNAGDTAGTFALSSSGHAWPTRILSGTTEVTATPSLPPCGVQDLSVAVDIPAGAGIGDEDDALITASAHPAGAPSESVHLSTAAFPSWQVEAPMPTQRYRLAAASLAGDTGYYAIGGWDQSNASSSNERYDACTGRWAAMAPMPTPVANAGAAVIGDRIYVPAGYDYGPYYDILQIYDTATNVWSVGAAMPQGLEGMAVAASGGRLYTFGGVTNQDAFTAQTYAYDPVANAWTEKSPLPGGPRAFGVAAELDGKIYVAGGWPNLKTVEVYDPASDAWSTASPMRVGRQSPGLTAAPDGYLHVSGGGDYWQGLGSAERYDPATDTWEFIPQLNDSDRAGSASAFAAGKVFAVGGSASPSSGSHESLRLSDAFCHSTKQTHQSAVQPGGRVTYTVEIHADESALSSARALDPIPAGTTFAGFGANAIGATYNSAADQVEWTGEIPAGAAPLTFTFGVDVGRAGWSYGEHVANTITFDDGAGHTFTRTALTLVEFPDPSPSTKAVDKAAALAGDALTYSIRLRNGEHIGGTFVLHDPIPAGTTYVPGSLTYTSGSGAYDPARDVITWTGTVRPDTYTWGDSDGSGSLPGVSFDWVDATGGSVAIGSYVDDGYTGPFDIGFPFSYYDTEYTEFYVNSNGSVQFGGGYVWYDPCPIDSTSPNNAIHLLGRDTVVDGDPGKVYYQTFGAAPNRYTVVEFHRLRNYGGSEYSDLEVILYENGDIKLQYGDVASTMTSGTVGIDDSSGTNAVQYLDTCPATVHDDLAVRFGTSSAEVTFAVTTASPLPINTWITNTATISGPFGAVARSAGTLINPVDLSPSTKRAGRAEATLGEVVTYDFVLENAGLHVASGVTLADPIPPETTYVPGSLDCSDGVCLYAPGAVTWAGDVAPEDPVTLTFAVTLTTRLTDGTRVTNTATLDGGDADPHELSAAFLARSSNLSRSFKHVTPTGPDPGDTVTYTIYVRNTGVVDTTAEVRDELPPQLAYVPGSVTCGTGSCSESDGVITWAGTAHARAMIPVRFAAKLSPGVSDGDRITNTAVITDTVWGIGYDAPAVLIVGGPAPGPCAEVQGAHFSFAPARPRVGETVTFTGSVLVGDTPISYTWAFGDGSTGNGQIVTHAFPVTRTKQTYSVVMTATNGCPSQDTAIRDVTVWPHQLYLPLVVRNSDQYRPGTESGA